MTFGFEEELVFDVATFPPFFFFFLEFLPLEVVFFLLLFLELDLKGREFVMLLALV